MRDGGLNLDEQQNQNFDSQLQTLETLCIELSLELITCRYVHNRASRRNARRAKGAMPFLFKLWLKLFWDTFMKTGTSTFPFCYFPPSLELEMIMGNMKRQKHATDINTALRRSYHRQKTTQGYFDSSFAFSKIFLASSDLLSRTFFSSWTVSSTSFLLSSVCFSETSFSCWSLGRISLALGI